VTSAGQQLLSVVDTAVVGRLGAVEIGAVGMGHAVFGFVMVLGMGVMLGLDPLMSQAVGAGQPIRARMLVWQGVWLSLAVGTLFSTVLVLTPWVLPLAGVPMGTTRLTGVYLWSRAPGLLPILTFIALRGYLQAFDSTRPMLMAMVLANLCNAPLAWILVHGAEFGGFTVPALGVVGAGVATTLCSLLQVVVVARAVQRHAVDGLPKDIRALRMEDVRHAWQVGFPISLQMGAEVGVFALVGVLAGRLGEQELAGHQIALTVASMSFMVSLGVGTAGSIRVGRAVGAKDRMGARLAGLVAFTFGGAFMTLSAAALWANPHFFARIMTDQPDVIAMSVRLLAVAAVFQLADGIQAVGAGVLRGAGDTTFLSRINIGAYYFIALPVAAWLGFGLDMGIMGLWWGLCVGLFVVAAGLFVRFLQISAREIAPLQRPDVPLH